MTDENVHGAIVRGLRRRLPDLDLVRAQDAGLRAKPDPEVLEWTAGAGRALVTQDTNTMVGFAWDRVRRGLAMPGVIAVPRGVPLGRAVEELELLAAASEEGDLDGLVVFLGATD